MNDFHKILQQKSNKSAFGPVLRMYVIVLSVTAGAELYWKIFNVIRHKNFEMKFQVHVV